MGEGGAEGDGVLRYRQLVDELREGRRLPGWKAFDDRPLLEQLEDLWEQLSDEDQLLANQEGWRAWPDRYDARMAEAARCSKKVPT